MSRNLRLLIDLVSAGGFYYVFGILILRPPGSQAFTSIVPVIHAVALVISVALVVLAVRRYASSASKPTPALPIDELSRREAAARKRIISVYGEPEQEYGVTLFVSHHLAEIATDFWIRHTGTANPEPAQVLGILELRIESEEGDIAILDFTLPDGVTEYVLGVEFDRSGNIVSVEMES